MSTPQEEENKITVELTAFEGICLIEAVTAHIASFTASPQRSRHIPEVQALHAFVTRMTPQVREMALKEEALLEALKKEQGSRP